MYIDSSRRAVDLPPPPTVDEVAAQMTVPLLTLADQASLEEAGAGRAVQTQDGAPLVESVALSYTLWRYPADRDDPRNLAELSPAERAGLAVEPTGPLPDWLLEARARLRYPMLWEGVRTTHVFQGTARSSEDVLAEHVNYIVMNAFRDERVVGGFPGELTRRVGAGDVRSGCPVVIDGTELEGVRVDEDPHVLGLGVAIDSRILTAVIPKEFLPYLRLEFVTRPS